MVLVEEAREEAEANTAHSFLLLNLEKLYLVRHHHIYLMQTQALQLGPISLKTPGRDADGRLLQDNPEEGMAMGGGNGEENPGTKTDT